MFSEVVVSSYLNKNFGGSTDLAKKRHGSADLHTPIQPPQLLNGGIGTEVIVVFYLLSSS